MWEGYSVLGLHIHTRACEQKIKFTKLHPEYDLACPPQQEKFRLLINLFKNQQKTALNTKWSSEQTGKQTGRTATVLIQFYIWTQCSETLDPWNTKPCCPSSYFISFAATESWWLYVLLSSVLHAYIVHWTDSYFVGTMAGTVVGTPHGTLRFAQFRGWDSGDWGLGTVTRGYLSSSPAGCGWKNKTKEHIHKKWF